MIDHCAPRGRGRREAPGPRRRHRAGRPDPPDPDPEPPDLEPPDLEARPHGPARASTRLADPGPASSFPDAATRPGRRARIVAGRQAGRPVAPGRRWLATCLALLAGMLAWTSCAAGSPSPAAAGAAAGPSPSAPAQLPLGGRELLPHYRVVAHYGSAGGGALGVLGEGTPEQAARRVVAAAKPFATADRPVQPAMELIATVASASPGPDGLYSSPLADSAVMPYLAATRAHHMLLVLDLQPGRGRFLDQARRYERFLREPDVGLALDPEWKMGPDQVPGQKIGSSSAADLNEVSAWLAGIVRRNNLPQKLFVVHQFTRSMVPDRSAVVARPELASVFHIDGFGGRQDKLEKYALLHTGPPFFNGIKLFLRQDIALFSPAEALALTPAPDLITYQ